jgi:hypothetical protein
VTSSKARRRPGSSPEAVFSRRTPPVASARLIAVTADGHVRYSKVGLGLPSSVGEVSITAGRPNGHRMAMPVTSRAVLPSCPDKIETSETERALLLPGGFTKSWW